MWPFSRKRVHAITRIMVLIHPLYSLIHPPNHLIPNAEDSTDYRLADPYSRKNVSYVLGLWGAKIAEAAKDPQTVLVILENIPSPTQMGKSGVESDTERKNWLRKTQWVRQKTNRLMAYAIKKLGQRAIIFGRINPLTDIVDLDPVWLRDELKRRKFHLKKSWDGELFGEYAYRCAKEALVEMEKGHLPQPGWVRINNALSTDPLNPLDKRENIGVGSFHENLRKKARGNRRKRRTK